MPTKQYTFHLVALPHTQVTKDKYSQCAYTQKTRKFANMMTSLGHKVYLYASEEHETDAELITCITKEAQNAYMGNYDWFKRGEWYNIPFDSKLDFWKYYNHVVIKEIKKRIKKYDFILLPAGNTMGEIISAFPYIACEYGIGYYGVRAKYKVFESYALMHYVYGQQGDIADRRFDQVIPNYFEIDDFPYSIKDREDYFLYMSRPSPHKGLAWVQKLARKHRVISAGAAEIEGLEWAGYADPKKRGELMSRAKALLCPTFYVEPFGGVVIEAGLCGTPVVTTDWGAFTETVKQAETGYRVHSYPEFEAICEQTIHMISPSDCRQNALRYSTDVVRYKYHSYFERLHHHWTTTNSWHII